MSYELSRREALRILGLGAPLAPIALVAQERNYIRELADLIDTNRDRLPRDSVNTAYGNLIYRRVVFTQKKINDYQPLASAHPPIGSIEEQIELRGLGRFARAVLLSMGNDKSLHIKIMPSDREPYQANINWYWDRNLDTQFDEGARGIWDSNISVPPDLLRPRTEMKESEALAGQQEMDDAARDIADAIREHLKLTDR